MPDPFNPQSLNRFAYCTNNPVRYVDPTGHWESDHGTDGDYGGIDDSGNDFAGFDRGYDREPMEVMVFPDRLGGILLLDLMYRFGNIEISANEISEYDRDRKIIVIPKEKTKKIYLLYGFSEDRPLVSILVGLITIYFGFIFGLNPILQILISLFNGQLVRGSFVLYALATPLLLLGAWLMLSVHYNIT